MMMRAALQKLSPLARLQLERHPIIRELVPGPIGHGGEYEQLLNLYTTAQGAGRLLAKLTAVERNALRSVVKHFANEPFSEASLVKRSAENASGSELRMGLAGLCSAGIVVTVRKAWGERLHALPFDALGAWQLALFGEPDVVVPDTEAEVTVSSLGALDDDLFALLAFAAKQELVLTQKGTIHKRQLQALHSLLRLPGEEGLKRMVVSYGNADTYGIGFAAVLDAALRLELVAAEGGVLRLQPSQLRAWLRRPRGLRSRALLSAWTAQLWPIAPLVQHAAAAVLHSPRGVWLALPRLAAWLGGIAAGAAAELLVQRSAEQWLEPLAALGWLELARHSRTGEMLVRVPALVDDSQPEPSGRFYVQPDFELIVPPDVPAAVRWELELCADRVSTDQMHVYRIGRESIQFACECGASAESIENFLEVHGMYALSDHVRMAIRQWAGSFGRVSFARTMLLRCEDGELADQIARHPKLATKLLERIGDRDFIVPSGCVEELQSTLDKAGYAPRKAVTEPGEPGEGALAHSFRFPLVRSDPERCDGDEDGLTLDEIAEGSSANGLLYATDPLLYYELEPELPNRPERYEPQPDMRDIPSVWWKDYRTYHASTRKDMLRKAIEFQSLVKLRMGGEDRMIAPKRLLEEPGGWSLVGIERGGGGEIRYAGDEWEEMKLVLPGWNDR